MTTNQENPVTINQTPASTSDARKRNADSRATMGTIDQPVDSTVSNTTNQEPPSLPDMSGWVRLEPGDLIPAGTPYVYVAKYGESFSYKILDHEWHAAAPGTYWTPPPKPEPEPAWSVLSTDRDNPTLAKVTWKDAPEYETTAEVFVEDGHVWRVNDSSAPHQGAGSQKIGRFEDVTDVELLHTHNPETHVPVERALIDEAVRLVELDMPHRLRDLDLGPVAAFLAALADGAQS